MDIFHSRPKDVSKRFTLGLDKSIVWKLRFVVMLFGNRTINNDNQPGSGHGALKIDTTNTRTHVKITELLVIFQKPYSVLFIKNFSHTILYKSCSP